MPLVSGFLLGCWELNSGPQACMAEPYPQTMISSLLDTVHLFLVLSAWGFSFSVGQLLIPGPGHHKEHDGYNSESRVGILALHLSPSFGKAAKPL